MPDESIRAVAIASEVELTTAVNGVNDVQSALNLTNGAAWIPTAIPTSDPHVVGQIWANSHVLTVSAG